MLFVNCAYYNTFFNAKKFFKEAENARKNSKDNARRSSNTSTTSSAAKQKYTKAIEKASRLLEFYPNSKYVDDALFLLGKCFFYKEEYRKAKRKFEELINNFPQSEFVPEARLWLGKTNTELRDYETAEKNFQDILRGKAKGKIIDEAQFLLGGLYFHKEDYVIALREYKTAAQHARDKALRTKAYHQMGECYLQLKDYAAAAASFEKARKYSPDAKSEFEALFKAGLARKDLKEYDEAIDIFTELLGDINNEENWPDCKYEISDCLYLKGEIGNAISWYESIITDHKRTDAAAKAYFDLGLIYQMEKSDYKQAQEYYELASKEYSRSEIVPEAKNKFNSIKNLLALKADIKEQEKRIAAGDSIAAEMDSLEVEVDTSYTELEDTTRFATDTTLTDRRRTSLNALERGNTSLDSTSNDYSNFFPDDTLRKRKNIPEKVSLKTGELGTPEEELIKDKLMLGEIYLFEFDQPDSALFEYLDVLEQDTTVAIASKAAYSIGFIFDKFKKDSVAADSVYKKLIETYPNTIYAELARDHLNLPNIEKTEDIALEKFKKAEKEYLDNNNLNIALSQYEKIATNYPESKFASKSLFAMGWIYETDLNKNDKALEIYQKLVDDYPETDHAKNVKKKIDEVNRQQQEKESDKPSEAAKDEADAQKEGEEKTSDIDDLALKDKESYRKLLTKEMQKDNRRLRNPKRIIK